MLTPQLQNALLHSLQEKVRLDEPMRKHTSFRIGGPADALIIPHGEDELKRIVEFARHNTIPVTIVGSGTNLLVSDDGIPGIVIKVAGCLDNVTFSGREVSAGAGCSLARLSNLAADYGLAGIEFAVGIPGALGGAVTLNAGARGASIGDLVRRIRVIDFKGEPAELTGDDVRFGYRKSEVKSRNVIVLSAVLELEPGNTAEIKGEMREYLRQRRMKQPLGLPSAGSIFKNPKDDHAGRLIEECGCKGMRVGDAQVSGLHANFIVNKGNATAQDVLRLMSKIREAVLVKYGIELEPEIHIMGKGMETVT